MDKKLKMKWVKALESRRFRQAEGELYDNEGKYCCLGVLCRMVGLPNEKIKYEATLGDVKQGHLLPSATMMKLVAMNDEGYSFKEIAAWIRAHL